LALGSPVAALRSYRHALEIEPNNTIAQREVRFLFFKFVVRIFKTVVYYSVGLLYVANIPGQDVSDVSENMCQWELSWV